MKITLDFSQLTAEKNRSANAVPQVHKKCVIRVSSKSLQIMESVKRAMPVDTGAARARWGSPGAPGGIWEVEDDGLSITQGAALEPYEYIIRLNEGSSTQAPAGFLDAIEFKYSMQLVNELINDVISVI